ncbi:glutathione hydrolase 7-like [Anabas testudineus]|uniref:glutathione hydrolase 7-like n=1 Tax=Anabas testudineus TaxID=64144 RepID=UPI000E45F27E|nr:glutathione hydrolase 7-like [Anabas testudineus]
MGSGLWDPKNNSSVTKLHPDMLSKNHTDVRHQRINFTRASTPRHNNSIHSLQTELQSGQVVVMGSDDLMVSVASSLSRTFGSRLVTRSGVILNSLILGFSWPNKATGQQISQVLYCQKCHSLHSVSYKMLA